MKIAVLLPLLAVAAAVAGTAAAPNTNALNFMVMGDWGGQSGSPYTTPGELAVAEQMAKTGPKINSQFVLAVGDNFYDDGVSSASDPRFQTTFENVFNKTAFNTTFYVVAGNHDHKGNVQGEVEYSKRDSRWNYPSLYNSFTKTIPGSAQTVQFLMIDTVTLCDVGDPTQYNWIKTTLANSKANWVIVGGHYPVWSVASHGPTVCLIQYIEPLLTGAKVAAYINGHDHNQQHIAGSGVVDYYVTGGAHGLVYSDKHKHDVPHDSLKFFFPPASGTKALSSFITVSVSESTMVVQYLDNEGNLLYQTSKSNPRA